MAPKHEANIAEVAARYGLPSEVTTALLGALRPGAERALPARAPDRSTVTAGTWDPDAEQPAPALSADHAVPGGLPSRYRDLGLIGSGGMGEVRRVHDRELERVVAMKIIRLELAHDRGAVERFLVEARATASLEHPAIVPAHDLGRLPDGRVYFTMKEVRGRTLASRIEEVHRDAGAVGERTWTQRRLIEVLHKVCEAVAFAHTEGVVHGDLKPSNVMVGEFGEVLVVDWGLAHRKGLGDPVVGPIDRAGKVTGTPAYMAPELVSGARQAPDTRTDVYALGAVLYEILAGRRAYPGRGVDTVLTAVRAGPPHPPKGRLLVPEDLARVVTRAMARDALDRYRDAASLETEIAAWLAGARKRERARQLVRKAKLRLPTVELLRDRVETTRERARALLAPVHNSAPVEQKRAGWMLEDAARRMALEVDVKALEVRQLLRTALTDAPDLVEAHDLLADEYRQLHTDAEARGDAQVAARLEHLMRAHDTGRHAAYLEGVGALSLITEPPATVHIHRYVERDRRLVPRPHGAELTTPIERFPLPKGSYLLELHAPGYATARYPVRIDRQQHWSGARPGSDRAVAVRLLEASVPGEDDCYVPAGICQLGGDPEAPSGRPARTVWLNGFIVRRSPVTNEDYLTFLNDLWARDQREQALAHAPRDQGAPDGLAYALDPDLGFRLQDPAGPGARGPDYPVVQVDYDGAIAYANWYGAQTGQPWRLPTRDEWEKAARGVDGRRWPWGNYLDPTFCCMRDSHVGPAQPAPVTAFPVDTSPYGVRGMGGNAMDWCESTSSSTQASQSSALQRLRPKCGGGWFSMPALTRSANAASATTSYRNDTGGFRLCRDLP